MDVDVLVRNRWMIGFRGALAIALALALLLWPAIGLGTIVVIFAIYAIVDGLWLIAAAVRVSARMFDAWPVALAGCVSTGIGATALVWPFPPRDFVIALGAWGVATGALEALFALTPPRHGARPWLLVTGGLSSIFLAVLVIALPLADVDAVVRLLVAYAVVFGAAMLGAASHFSPARPAAAVPHRQRLAR
jgi:uncharacterized membrane protein HdeD (DUF308 family)